VSIASAAVLHLKESLHLFRSSRVGITIQIDLGDIGSHYCTLKEDVRDSVADMIDFFEVFSKLNPQAAAAANTDLASRGL
jgi:hypothetical protein